MIRLDRFNVCFCGLCFLVGVLCFVICTWVELEGREIMCLF